MKNVFQKVILPIIHGIILMIALLSPFWADWKIVIAGFALYLIQKWIFKECVLTFAEFGKKDDKPAEFFTAYYLKQIFKFKTETRVVARYLDLILAPLVPIIAIIIQVVFSFHPLIINYK